jgi:protein gp37
MGERTEIAWTSTDGEPGATFNPWWNCVKVSPGCDNCYAEAWAKRVGLGWGSRAGWRFFGDAHWNEPRKWAAKARKSGVRRKVFCASMCDVFQVAEELDAPRARLADLIRETADALSWLLLTKRPQNFRALPPDVLSLCWLGVTVENQRAADERIPLLLATPARVRFLSVEPMLEGVDLRFDGVTEACRAGFGNCPTTENDGRCYCRPDWVIVGGESGPRARPFDLAWARAIRDQCRDAGVPYFFKQTGANAQTGFYDDKTRREWEATRDWPAPIGWDEHDGQPMLGSKVRLPFRDRSGADPAEWPEDLRVREFPR